MKREIVVTGLGAVTPLGVGARTLHERWTAGTSGIEDGEGACTEFEPTEYLTVKEVRRAGMASTTASGTSLVMSVSMKPGATALTVTPRRATSAATVLVRPIRPALAAA